MYSTAHYCTCQLWEPGLNSLVEHCYQYPCHIPLVVYYDTTHGRVASCSELPECGWNCAIFGGGAKTLGGGAKLCCLGTKQLYMEAKPHQKCLCAVLRNLASCLCTLLAARLSLHADTDACMYMTTDQGVEHILRGSRCLQSPYRLTAVVVESLWSALVSFDIFCTDYP